MGIIAVDRPQSGATRQRFTQDECVAAADLVESGGAASDGQEYGSRKVAQQAAWELRQGMAEHAGLETENLTSKTVETADGSGLYTFAVYAKS